MIETQAIFVEGVAATERTLLAQQLKIALEQAGIAHQWLHPLQAGHPLRRPWDERAYGCVEDFCATLEAQWHNFAVRAAAEGGVWILDACVLEPAAAELIARGDEDAASRLTDRLLEAAAPLRPCMLYLWRDAPASADPDPDAWRRRRDFADAWFARRHEPRLLMNASRGTEAQLREDALDFLQLDDTALAAPVTLAGLWRERLGHGQQIRVEFSDDVLMAHDLPGAPDAAPRRLLPAPGDRFLVAGEALALQLQASGGQPTLQLQALDERSDLTPLVFERA